MTTTVQVAISGNKKVRIKVAGMEYDLEPGKFHNFMIHGDQELSVKEEGEFITVPQGAVFVPKPAAEPV